MMMMIGRRRCQRSGCYLLLVSYLLCCLPRVGQASEADSAPAAAVSSGESSELDAAASEAANSLTSESHKVIASGWPSTSSMWPSIDIDDDSKPDKQQRNEWFQMIEPFIYADKPRTGDYSLLLKINSTVLEALKAHLKPMSVNLSFEYYFNHDQKSTALPLIKIEVNRKEFKYLDPNGQSVRSRRWMKFNERIQIADLQQLDKHDWLKISLVNRDEPSIVAVRRLEAEFRSVSDTVAPADTSNKTPAPKNQPNDATNLEQQEQLAPKPGAQPAPPNGYSPPPSVEPPRYLPVPAGEQPVPNNQEPPPAQPPVDDSAGGDADSGNEITNYPQQGDPLPQPAGQPPLPGQEAPPGAGSSPPPDQQTYTAQDLQTAASEPKTKSTKPTRATTVAADAAAAAAASDPMTPSASEILTSTIKPVAPSKKKGWGWPGKRRRRRDTTGGGLAAGSLANATVIKLDCHRSDDCEWQSDTKDEGIQWSLARMPTSTSTVQAGYYYNSNRNNYGDASKLLRLSLNQTERATIVDQNSDHCMDLAIYVTERTFLRMYRLTRVADTNEVNNNDDSGWLKGSLLMSWAPTLALNDSSSSVQSRISLPGSRLASMEAGQNGWTVETFCFGDFFTNPKECGADKCAFGFVMDTTADQQTTSTQPNQATSGDRQPAVGGEPDLAASSTTGDGQFGAGAAEQVVGVSILKEYSRNIPIKPDRLRWLETWQRDEVEPADEWRFYPKLDYQINGNNISFVNLHNDAHYFVESDWLQVDDHLDLTAILSLEDKSPRNFSQLEDQIQQQHHHENGNIFTLKVKTKLLDSSFDSIYANETLLDWNIYTTVNGSSSVALNISITDHLRAARGGELRRANKEEDNLFKVVFEFVLDLRWLLAGGGSNDNELVSQYLNSAGGSQFRISLSDVSVSDRCFPNQCEHGGCQQNGTGLEDWNCRCEDKYRGRRCEFGHWCNVPHISPWNPSVNQQQNGGQKVTLKVPTNGLAIQGNTINGGRQPKAMADSVRVTGQQFCKSKLGPGYRCTDIDLALNENLYTDEDKTFYCSCKNDYYLSDDSKCRQTHACNSILCPSIGLICDESKPFNQTQPCHCNERQDWFPDLNADGATRCVRRQCHDKQRDCGFEAHLCIPTLPGERPICKCGPKFTLKIDPESGKKSCQSTACVLPTLNDCQQICVPDNSNMTHPYTCACHPGFVLDSLDGRTCKPERSGSKGPYCKPACQSDGSQICTDHGCRCKQGYVGEGEQKVRRMPKGSSASKGSNNNSNSNGTATTSPIEYTESIRCLNICSLSYAENKEEFEMIESVCPLGLCDPNSFQCKCSDPASVTLANEKYEPIYANCSSNDNDSEDNSDSEHDGELSLVRVSPLCHLKRVCEPDSSSYKVCKSQGAICVPDYTKPAKFDCICPPSTEKRPYGQGTVAEFTCESKCSSKKSDCLRKQAVCKQIDRDQVRCDCLPGFMLQDNVCYLAKYSYSMNLVIVNKYYEPEARFRKLIEFNSTTIMGDHNPQSASKLCPRKKTHSVKSTQDPTSDQQANNNQQQQAEDQEHLSEIVPQFNRLEGRSTATVATKMTKSIFIADYNQCNITQIIPKSVIEDPYEHDIESYLGYIEQCNEKIHQNMRNYHLNSRLSEDVRQSLRQHLRDFTVTTNNSSCVELDSTGLLLNCTIYLQSNEPIEESTANFVFNDCDKNAHDGRYCWIKPRLLLLKRQQSGVVADRQQSSTNQTDTRDNQLNFKQIVPCEIGNFCGLDAVSSRIDERTSLCSCKCPTDIEVIDVKDLEPRRHDDDPTKVAVKEICAPRNHCGANSTHCLLKTGSVCLYDIRTGSRCICIYPSYEDSSGKCVEVAFSQLDNTLIVIVIMLGTALLVSVFLNILVAARTKSMFGRSKQYPMNEFSPPPTRPMNRSTGVPNPVFDND